MTLKKGQDESTVRKFDKYFTTNFGVFYTEIHYYFESPDYFTREMWFYTHGYILIYKLIYLHVNVRV